MTTLVLLLLAGFVVAWVARRAGVTDTRDETDRYARLQHLGSGWTADTRASQSGNDLGHRS